MKFYKRLIQPRYAVEIRRTFKEIQKEENGSINIEYIPVSTFMGKFELEGIEEWFPEDQELKLRETYSHMCESHGQKLVFAEKFVPANEEVSELIMEYFI